MAEPVDSSAPVGGGDDGLIAAYLDGELDAAGRAAFESRLADDAALRDRLHVMEAGSRPFSEAFGVLLAAAPADRLRAMLAATVADSSRQPARVRGGVVRRLAMLAAALAIFALGAVAGGAWIATRPADPPGWRQVVAEYFVLVTPETLQVVRNDPEALSAELVTIGAKLPLDLTPGNLALSDAELKRAQLYQFNGRPLVQLAYLVDATEPMALCIIANGRPDADIAFEEREGSNVVFWTHNGLGYMLIGKAGRPVLEAYADDLAKRFTTG